MSIVLPNAADIPAFAGIPGDVAAHNVPIASAVACDSAVAKFITAFDVPWIPAVVTVSAGVPAATVVLFAVDIPGVPAVADLTYLLLLVFQVYDVPLCCWHPGYCVPNVVNYQTVVFNGSGVLAVGLPNFPVIFCAVVGHSVDVFISVVNVTCATHVCTLFSSTVNP
jgi:hypothetical protein